MDIVGIIPAAGTATRLSPLPCSKEILPVGMEQWGDKPYRRPKVAIQYLLDAMREAGIKKTYLIIRNNKWDIPAFLGDGNAVTYSIIENGSYIDIGTLDDYSGAVSEYWPD